jgi:hypothetical protein
MKAASLWRYLFVVIIITILIGGVIIIIIRGPIPEPVCPACIARRIVPWGIAEILSGIAALVLIGKIRYEQRPVRRRYISHSR